MFVCGGVEVVRGEGMEGGGKGRGAPNRIRDTAPKGEYGTAKRVRSLLSLTFSTEEWAGLS